MKYGRGSLVLNAELSKVRTVRMRGCRGRRRAPASSCGRHAGGMISRWAGARQGTAGPTRSVARPARPTPDRLTPTGRAGTMERPGPHSSQEPAMPPVLRCRAALAALALLAAPALAAQSAPTSPGAAVGEARPPVARVVPRVDTIHGEVVVDDYAWLRDKTDSAVIRHLEAENAFTEAMTRHTAPVRDSIYKEILGRTKETDASPPYLEDGYWYYTRTEKGKSYPIFCRRKGSPTAPEEVILDQNALAAGKKLHALGGVDVS